MWKRRGHVSRNLDQHNNWQFPYLSSSEVRDKMAQLFPLWWGQELCVAAGWGRAAVQCPTFAKLVIWRAINMTSWPANSVKLHVKLLILQNTYTVTQHLANVARYLHNRVNVSKYLKGNPIVIAAKCLQGDDLCYFSLIFKIHQGTLNIEKLDF